jgi:hypothetical protein
VLTTKPIPAALVSAFPELELRTTVRLHPRGGRTTLEDSKLGGDFVWPAEETWPVCADHGDPLVGVLQLRCEEVPEVGCPEGRDLFQLLWCPKDHEDTNEAPLPQVFWRRSDDVVGQTVAPHPAVDANPDYLPEPCRLFPERVVEFPDTLELDEGTQDRIEDWIRSNYAALVGDGEVWPSPDGGSGIPRQANYGYSFSTAPGTKVGGFPCWIQAAAYPSCEQGHRMEHLLTVDSGEFDGGTWWRWLPAEERDVWAGPTRARLEVQAAANLMIGDGGSLYVFVCRRCDTLPISASSQCS